MRRKFSVHDNGGPSQGSTVRIQGSQDPHRRREGKFYVNFLQPTQAKLLMAKPTQIVLLRCTLINQTDYAFSFLTRPQTKFQVLYIISLYNQHWREDNISKVLYSICWRCVVISFWLSSSNWLSKDVCSSFINVLLALLEVQLCYPYALCAKTLKTLIK